MFAIAKKMHLIDTNVRETGLKLLDLTKARKIEFFICFSEKDFRFCGYSTSDDTWFSENAHIISLRDFFRKVKERQCRGECT